MNAEEMTADEIEPQEASGEHSSLDAFLRYAAYGSGGMIAALCVALLLHQMVISLGSTADETPRPILHHASSRVTRFFGLHPAAASTSNAPDSQAGKPRRDVRYCLNLPHPDTHHRCAAQSARAD